MVDTVEWKAVGGHPPFPSPGWNVSQKWQFPLYVYSVGGIDDNVHIAQVLEGDDLSNFLSIG